MNSSFCSAGQMAGRVFNTWKCPAAVSLVGLLVVIVVSGLLPGESFATTPSFCSSEGFDVYSASEATLEECGDKSFPLTGVTETADGGHAYHYEIEGMEATTLVPPASFQPAHASASELRLYGLREPNENSPRWPRWENMIGHVRFESGPRPSRAITVPNKEDFNVEAPISNVGGHIEAGESQSLNWSGYVNYSSTQQYTEATAIYAEPNPSVTCSKASLVTWAGLGGYNSHSLAQNGTIDRPGVPAHNAWWEILPASLVLVGEHATAGALFEVETFYAGNKKFFFWFFNSSDNSSITVEVTTSYGIDLSTADYIAERPTVNGKRVPLANFGDLEISGFTEGGQSVSKFPNNMVNMGAAGIVLATPTALSGPSFVDIWHACGKEE